MATAGPNTSDTVTESVRVQTRSWYVPEHSDPLQRRYFFAYEIRITNEGPWPVTLLNRHWIITDGLGGVEEVKGRGVVGRQPRIRPGETFQYTSFCPLRTRTGCMRGAYEFVRDDASRFHVAIGEFKLLVQAVLN